MWMPPLDEPRNCSFCFLFYKCKNFICQVNNLDLLQFFSHRILRQTLKYKAVFSINMWEQQTDVLVRKGMKALIAAVKIIIISEQPSGIAKLKKKKKYTT